MEGEESGGFKEEGDSEDGVDTKEEGQLEIQEDERGHGNERERKEVTESRRRGKETDHCVFHQSNWMVLFQMAFTIPVCLISVYCVIWD